MLALGDDTAAVARASTPRRTRVLVVLLAVLLSAGVGDRRGAGRLRRPGRAGDRAAARAARARAAAAPRAAAAVGAVRGGRGARRRRASPAARSVPRRGVEVPTGVVTSLVGAVFLVCWPAGSAAPGPIAAGPGGARRGCAGGRFVVIGRGARCGARRRALAGALLGDAVLLHRRPGQLGPAGPARSSPTCSTRGCPRVLAAVLAGAALAVAGAVIQAVCRNPLAEPGILGVTGGAGVGAVLVITPRARPPGSG